MGTERIPLFGFKHMDIKTLDTFVQGLDVADERPRCDGRFAFFLSLYGARAQAFVLYPISEGHLSF